MSKATDGGPAFPELRDGGFDRSGMKLRDWFAGQVVGGYLAMHSDPQCDQPEPKHVAQFAYRVADAMLAAREVTAAAHPV